MKSEPAPFDDVHVDVAVAVDEDPFAHAIHDEDLELEELVANARAVVATLEVALERARENERVLMARLKL